MKFSTILSTAAFVSSSVMAAPVNVTETEQENLAIPSEALIGYLDLKGDDDISILPVSNSTNSGLLFLNSTILTQAMNENTEAALSKREADANAWHWLSISPGQPMYIKRDANADADADADAWHWLSISPGQPMYIKRDANADADADADAWHWLSISPGQPMYI
ncbi:hypothetical protein KAFR_0C02130 [Kazachstania africana CBS 2517]|uniref:Mating factor alpha n=1 Tax=Kazachstania africana (strain ATCC 22294 / BCRC 22015 / CBS 2517 / CECT 1963 / NBRC 1671 / NRRL Y-8276) TaxID=1071382 RepID=H2AS56_KAZAF|nr:hypothetical protein KAFR_0C02130 [Kazachstania africana CBS 2517]CCF57206.1 hypothetical protein KAFR_0C02130 [Kazachstania africana CBS 2517]